MTIRNFSVCNFPRCVRIVKCENGWKRGEAEMKETKVMSKKDAFFLSLFFNCGKSKVLFEMSQRLLNRSVPPQLLLEGGGWGRGLELRRAFFK